MAPCLSPSHSSAIPAGIGFDAVYSIDASTLVSQCYAVLIKGC